MSARWSDVTVGETVVVDEAEMIVRAIRPGKVTYRVVLEHAEQDPDPYEPSAKVALKVRPDDEVELPEGGIDEAVDNVKNVLGGEVLGEVAGDGSIISPAMDVTTIAAHLKIMHGITLRSLDFSDEEDMLRIHRELHETAPYHEPAIGHTHEEK